MAENRLKLGKGASFFVKSQLKRLRQEDVGGIGGYVGFLETMADPDHEEHEETLRRAGGKFNPERFDAGAAMKAMKKGLADWRKEEWI